MRELNSEYEQRRKLKRQEAARESAQTAQTKLQELRQAKEITASMGGGGWSRLRAKRIDRQGAARRSIPLDPFGTASAQNTDGGTEYMTGWQRLRQRRLGGTYLAAIESAGRDAMVRRYQQPEVLSYGMAPRKETPFMEWHTVSLSEFERIVSIFGDYQSDKELARAEKQLNQLFAALDTAQALEQDARERKNGGQSAEQSHVARTPVAGPANTSVLRAAAVKITYQADNESGDAPASHALGGSTAAPIDQRSHGVLGRAGVACAPAVAAEAVGVACGGKCKSARCGRAAASELSSVGGSSPQNSFLSDTSTLGGVHEKLQRVDSATYADFLRRVHPLAPGEREGDAELIELMTELTVSHAPSTSDSFAPRRMKLPAVLLPLACPNGSRWRALLKAARPCHRQPTPEAAHHLRGIERQLTRAEGCGSAPCSRLCRPHAWLPATASVRKIGRVPPRGLPAW